MSIIIKDVLKEQIEMESQYRTLHSLFQMIENHIGQIIQIPEDMKKNPLYDGEFGPDETQRKKMNLMVECAGKIIIPKEFLDVNK